MDDKTLYNQQVERLRQKEAECFLTFLDRYSTLLKLARENNFSGEDCYRVVEAFLRMDSAGEVWVCAWMHQLPAWAGRLRSGNGPQLVIMLPSMLNGLRRGVLRGYSVESIRRNASTTR